MIYNKILLFGGLFFLINTAFADSASINVKNDCNDMNLTAVSAPSFEKPLCADDGGSIDSNEGQTAAFTRLKEGCTYRILSQPIKWLGSGVKVETGQAGSTATIELYPSGSGCACSGCS